MKRLLILAVLAGLASSVYGSTFPWSPVSKDGVSYCRLVVYSTSEIISPTTFHVSNAIPIPVGTRSFDLTIRSGTEDIAGASTAVFSGSVAGATSGAITGVTITLSLLNDRKDADHFLAKASSYAESPPTIKKLFPQSSGFFYLPITGYGIFDKGNYHIELPRYGYAGSLVACVSPLANASILSVSAIFTPGFTMEVRFNRE